MPTTTREWTPALRRDDGPLYLAIADAMAADIAAGRLRGGARLPTHRALAAALGVNLTTVTRAYAEAQRRGLIDAGIGRGTFVRHAREAGDPGATVDMTMNLPPQPQEAALRARLEQGLAALQRRGDFLSLLTYRPGGGVAEDRRAGAAWLQPRLGAVPPARILVCAGAQAALLALLTTFAQRGDTVLTEAVTYPGFRALAAHFGVRLKGVPVDAQGLVPEALEQACRHVKPRLLYCTPTIQNPTTATMSAKRRQAVAAVARRHGLMIFEDDAYGALPEAPLPPLAAIAPDITWHVAGLAKCIAPGLRIAYMMAPDADAATRLAAALRATTLMAPPLMAALATQWIGDGTAQHIVAAIRNEAVARQRIAAEILPRSSFAAHPEGHHLWLAMPAAWGRAQLEAHLRRMDLAIVPSDAFATDAPVPEAARIALGAARDQAQLRRALHLVAEALAQSPAALSTIV